MIKGNLLQQKFDETGPYHVLNTDVTEYKLTAGKKIYISPVIDEASLEILACQASLLPNVEWFITCWMNSATKLPQDAQPILHPDQCFLSACWLSSKLKEMNIVQSMSRKGNCHDNALGEIIFNLMKRECLNRLKISSETELKQIRNMFTGSTILEDPINLNTRLR